MRPEVLAFAEAMESQLKANDHKPGWKDDAAGPLLLRIREEVRELEQAVYGSTEADRPLILAEAADVANFAMMVADVKGALAPAEPDEAATLLRAFVVAYANPERVSHDATEIELFRVWMQAADLLGMCAALPEVKRR